MNRRMVAEAAQPKAKQSATKAAKAKREQMLRQAAAVAEAEKAAAAQTPDAGAGKTA